MLSAERVRKREEKEESWARQVIASNDDLLTELLLRLPIKSLLKFKCVCKHWLSIIIDPHFNRHRSLKSNAVSALYLQPSSRRYRYAVVPLEPSRGRTRFKRFTFADSPDGIKILQSCQGLFCCCSPREDKYFVYNPTTEQFKTLPPVPSPESVLGVSLAFDPAKSHSYKVVCVESAKSSHTGRKVLIYSSETGSWRVSGARFTAPIAGLLQIRATYWNGAIYWFSRSHTSLYFDLNEELVREMAMPPSPNPDGSHFRRVPVYLGESGGHLHLVDFHKDLFVVHEMERDRSGWFVKFAVDFNCLGLPCHRHFIAVLCVVRGEKEEDSFLVLHCPLMNKVIWYNFVRQTQRKSSRGTSRECWFSSTFQYIESLSLV